jgi:hypothetical protein
MIKEKSFGLQKIEAFNVLKNSLADAALLAHPSSNLPLVLIVDASDFAIGASLHQIRDGIFLQEALECRKELFHLQQKTSSCVLRRQILPVYDGGT